MKNQPRSFVALGAAYMNLSERGRISRTETCEEIYRSGITFGESPDYPMPTCD